LHAPLEPPHVFHCVRSLEAEFQKGAVLFDELLLEPRHKVR
jgi:hypothetical protein